MKTKTKFDSTSDARNLINSVVEKFPKGPERDGLQTKLREFYNCLVGAMRLPQGYDRLKVIEEGTQNLHAAQRIADRVDKQNGNAKFSTMISILASNLTDLKRDHSKTGKVEDNFYGKRVVKGIFAKAKFDKSNYYALEGTVDGNATGSKTVETIEEAMYYGKAMLEHMKKQSPKAKVATVHIFKVVNYQRENKPVKVLNSRTGSKAKFSHLSTMLDMLDYQSANDQEDLAKKNIKGLAQSIGKLNPTKDEWSRYVKIAKSLGFSESQIAGFARTGSKAKFAASKFEVGSTYEMRWDSQNFSHYKVLERTASTVKIEDIGNRVTNPDSSDASMRSKGVVIPQKGETVRVKIHTSGDGEFCFPTGRYSMSPTLKASKKVFARQGSKAKFANEEIAKGLSKVLKANGFDAMASEVLSGSTDSETLRKYIRALKSKMSPMSGNDRGMVLLETLEKQLASRTGAKVFK